MPGWQKQVLLLSLVLIFSGPAWAKEIAITFDDAPRGDGAFFTGPERATMLIKALQSAGVEGAAFFSKAGKMSDEGRERLDRYQAAGHYIANHSYSHMHPEQMGLESYIEDIAKADRVFRDEERFLRLYRFPYLNEGRSIEMRDGLRQGLQEMDYGHGYVTVDNYDWYLAHLFRKAIDAGSEIDQEKFGRLYVDILVACVEFYDNIAVKALGRSPAHVLLLHENDLAALFVGDLVAELRNRGWTIIDTREAYEDEIANDLPQTLFNGQGRVAAIAETMGYSRRSLVHESEDEQWLEQAVEQSGAIIQSPAEASVVQDEGRH